MVRSMTGYGKAETIAGARRITVEVRSVNGKQLDLGLRMPGRFRALDAAVRAAATRVLVRGKADIYINIESAGGAAERLVRIDGELFAAYIAQLRSLAETSGLVGDAVQETVMRAALRMPDVVSSEAEDEVSEEEAAALSRVLDDALAAIDEFRLTEGRVLMDDILSRIAAIERGSDLITPYEAARTEKIRQRIRESVESVGVAVDLNRLEQEMIYYIEKLDVTEEKVRLAGHCAYFREVVATDEAPGRKLGFIAQEIGREINTLGSKANDAAIQRIVVGMKDELEKIKEQLLNVL
ncbi:MAG: YicC family protein [Rikenellaceae bacterium]|nr:YicC family protein [Rikenellaceae bacterium]MCL2692462.1 YicC family protein [Rikenellaceae bacterium]